ncbi:MAG: hypothetical protein ACE5HQ_07905 [Gemmatimonadota bacterium]
MNTRTLHRSGPVLALVLLAACASGGNRRTGPVATIDEVAPSDRTVVVRIRNNLVPHQSVIVSVLSPTRPERVLGSILSDEVGVYEIDTAAFPGSYRLMARKSDGRVLLARPLSIVGWARIDWNMNPNILTVDRVRTE